MVEKFSTVAQGMRGQQVLHGTIALGRFFQCVLEGECQTLVIFLLKSTTTDLYHSSAQTARLL